MNADSLRDWLPMRLVWNEEVPSVEWCHLLGNRFETPFLLQTTERCMAHPFNLLFRQRTSLPDLVDLASGLNTPPPAGFIFHLTRCGSTLLLRQLRAIPGAYALSEPALLESLSALPARAPRFSAEEVVSWLRAAVQLLAVPRHPEDQRAWIKLGPVSTLQLSLFRRAFPEVPWLFVYRDPLEVLVSLAAAQPGQMLPGAIPPSLLGLEPSQLFALSPDEYNACFVEQLARAALAAVDDRGLLVEYTELPEAAWGRIARHFGLQLSPEEQTLLRQAAQWNAKTPGERWQPDAARKQKAASPRLKELAARIQPVYHALRRKSVL